jgi:hypothetical protein
LLVLGERWQGRARRKRTGAEEERLEQSSSGLEETMLSSGYKDMKRFNALLLAVFMAGSTFTSGCAAVAYQTRKADREARERAAYSEYRVEMERINAEREIAGLPPRPLLTFDEWRMTAPY